MRVRSLARLVPTLLIASAIHGRQQSSAPDLRVSLPQTVAAIQAASPGVRITPTYGGDTDVSYWKVSTPVRLVGGTGACAFEVKLTNVPHGAATLIGTPDGMIRSLQVDSFGAMPETAALAAAQKLSTNLETHGWVRTANEKQHTSGELHTLLKSGPAVSLQNLSCGAAHIHISAQQTTDRQHRVTYSLLYEQPLQSAPNCFLPFNRARPETCQAPDPPKYLIPIEIQLAGYFRQLTKLDTEPNKSETDRLPSRSETQSGE